MNQPKVNNEVPDLFEAVPVEEIHGEATPLEQESLIIRQMPQMADIDQKLAEIDKVFEYLEKMKSYCIKNLNKNRIANYSGKAYLTETAVNQFSSVFGIYEKDLKIEAVYADGSKRLSNDPTFLQGSIEYFFISGTVGSKTFGVEASFEGGAKIKELNDNVKDDKLFWLKKAKANWRRRAISKLLGLDGISWEELGLNPEDCVQVNIGSTVKADSEKANEVWNKLLELCNGNTKEAESLCSEMTSFKSKDGKDVKGKPRPHNLTEKALDFLASKVENLLNTEKKKKAAEISKQRDTIIVEIGKLSEKDKVSFANTLDDFGITADELKKLEKTQETIEFLKEFKDALVEKIANQTGSAKS